MLLRKAFVQMLEKEKRPLLTNDSELDGLVSKFVWTLCMCGYSRVMMTVGPSVGRRIVKEEKFRRTTRTRLKLCRRNYMKHTISLN